MSAVKAQARLCLYIIIFTFWIITKSRVLARFPCRLYKHIYVEKYMNKLATETKYTAPHLYEIAQFDDKKIVFYATFLF